MTAPGFTLQDMRDELRTLEQELPEWPSVRERVARTRRWLDEENAALFAEAAAELESGAIYLSPSLHARMGGLWHLAGDRERSCARLGHAVADDVDWSRPPVGPASVLYLLGDYDRAAELAPDAPEGWLAAGARDRDVASVERARERWVAAQQLWAGGPQHASRGAPLTDWDWIEETFRLQSEIAGKDVPSHLEMLRRTGLLRVGAELSEPPVERPAPRIGFRVVAEGNGEAPPALEVTGPDDVTIVLEPGRVLTIARYTADQGWGANLSDGASSGEWILPPSEPLFQDAALWAANWLEHHGEHDTAADIRGLVAAHDDTG